MKLITITLIAFLATGTGAQSVGGSCQTPLGQQGICMSFLRCPPIRSLFIEVGRGNTPFSEFRKYVCHIGKEPYVCCAQGRITPSSPPSTSPPTCPVRSNQFGVNKESLLPSSTECGKQGLGDRIIGGEPAPIGAWPWMVALRGKLNGRGSWICGGTLISDRYVLTAAHCIEQNKNLELDFVRLGETSFSTNPDCSPSEGCAPSPQDIRVECVTIHHSYNRGCSYCNDIALLRLERPATLNRQSVQPICLPRNPEREMGFGVAQFQGKVAWAAGWGTVSGDPDRPVIPTDLRQVQLQIQDLPFCTLQKASYPDHTSVMCAGDGKGKDTCRGDSGGPLTLTSITGTVNFLVGITSKGPSFCGAEGGQGLYTNVYNYIPWILENLQP